LFYSIGTFADIDFWYSNVDDIPTWDSDVDEDIMIGELEIIEKESKYYIDMIVKKSIYTDIHLKDCYKVIEKPETLIVYM